MLDPKISQVLKDYMSNEEFARRCLKGVFPQERVKEYDEICSFLISHSA